MKAKKFVAMCTLTLIIAGVANAQEASRPAWKVGDTWVYNMTYGGAKNTYEVVAEQPDTYKVLVSRSNGTKSVLTYDRDGNLLTRGNVSFTPKRDVLHFPIRVGGSYTGVAYTYPHQRKPGVTVTMSARITSIKSEEVTVPAGTFIALRMDIEQSYKLSTGYSNSTKETGWYVPEVGRWVKYKMIDYGIPNQPEEMELVSFKRGE